MSRGDLLVLALLVTLTIASGLWFWTPDEPPARVQIRVEGRVVDTLRLNRDQNVKVEGLLGVSEIEIRDGRVRFLASPCTNRQCILRGWVEHSGDMAACLPNRVSVTIIGQSSWYDAVNF